MPQRAIFLIFLFGGALVPGIAKSQQPATPDDVASDTKAEIAELRRQVQEQRRVYESQIEELRRQVAQLADKPGVAATQPSAREDLAAAIAKAKAELEDAESRRPLARLGRAFESFNPDISVIADAVGYRAWPRRGDHATEEHEHHDHASHGDDDLFQFRELELAFQSPVDAHSRADIFVHLHKHDGEWQAGLCEGYLTLLTLPYDLQARFGKFRSAFGKANQMHTHDMPWVDRPNVISRFLGHEGLSSEGAELSWLVPNPWKKYFEWTVNVQNGRGSENFGGQAGDALLVNHLKYFTDLSRSATLELGASHATGPNDAGGRAHIEGIDLTYKWRPPREGLYRSLTWQNELLLSQKDQCCGGSESAWGAYSSLTCQFARRWSAFGRLDYAQFPDDSGSRDLAKSIGLTFHQSKYCTWRLAYKHTDAAGPMADPDRHEVWLQLIFGIGPHRAHKY